MAKINSCKIIFSIPLMALLGGHVVASTAVFTWKDHVLSIDASTPPALIYITDSQNNMSGADPLKPLNQFGRGTIVRQIPGSFVEQENSESDNVNGVFVPNASSFWQISLPDHGPETVTVHLNGVSTGVFQLWIRGLYAFKSRIPKSRNDMQILISTGQNKQIQVAFDASTRSLTATPLINNGDFSKDTQSACALGAIGPPEGCETLEALATKAEKEKMKGDSEAEATSLKSYLAVLDRLHSWGKSGQRKDWNDFKDDSECKSLRDKRGDGANFFAKEPAYSALRLDAETLLNGPRKHRIDDHDDRRKKGLK